MARTIKVGVIGTGGISRVHLEGYQKLPNVEIVAVCDLIPERAKAKAETFKVPKVFTSAAELLKLKEIDAVSVCTPNVNHVHSTILALKAGKHVICEKPMAMNSREAAAMNAAAKAAGKKLQIALHQRFRSDTQLIKQAIDDGVIGKPYFARSQSIRRRGVPAWGVFGQKKHSGGGPLIDIGVHAIDVTWYLMGKPTPVAVSGKTYETIGATPGHMGCFGLWDHKVYDVEDFAVGLVRFAGGETMSIESAFCVNVDKDVFGCQIVGDKGGAQLEPLVIQTEMAGHLMDCKPNFVQPNNAYDDEIKAFVTSIAENKPVLVPGTEAIWTTKIIDAIYESSRANKEIRLK
jgi:predicted dehydrogenase